MPTETKVTEANQTQVPAHLRAKFGIKPGDLVVWEETDDGVQVRFRRRRTMAEYFGSMPGLGPGDAVASKKAAQRGEH